MLSVCYEAEEDDEAFYGWICEYKLVKANMSEGHMGEMELLDTSPEEILLSSAENSQLLYEKSIDTEDSENFGKTELYLNEEKIAGGSSDIWHFGYRFRGSLPDCSL